MKDRDEEPPSALFAGDEVYPGGDVMVWSVEGRPSKGGRVRLGVASKSKLKRRASLRMERLEERTLLSGGVLDPSFGSGGVATLPGGTLTSVNDVALQSDGKAVVAGAEFGAMGLARLTTNGALDPTFGLNGTVTLNFAGGDSAFAVAIQPDGKIIAAGQTIGGASGGDFAIARFNPDGSLDTTFGLGGQRVVDFGGIDQANSIAIQPDGNIIVAGSNGFNFAMVRLLPNGTLDPTFGNLGKVVTKVTGKALNGESVLIQNDGKILLGGGAVTQFAIARYLPGGALDPSFGTNGEVFTSINGNNLTDLRAMALQPDGEIVAVGSTFVSGGLNAFALARYTTSGVLDSTFGNNGETVTTFSIDDKAEGVTLQPNGKILVAGTSAPGNVRLARYDVDGLLDLSFGTNGSVAVPSGDGHAIVLQSDGKVDVAGQVGLGVGVARYFTGNPLGDLTFSAPVFTAKEGQNPTATITVTRDGGSQGTVSVHFATSDGTAAAGVQYVATSGTLTFGPGVTSQTINVPILLDGMIDGTTTVNLALSNPGGGATLGDLTQATLDIQDASGSLQFLNPTFTVLESAQNAVITVTRQVGDGGAVTVDFATSDGSGIGGTDYVPTSGTLFFADGQTTSSFTVPIIPDPLAAGTLTVNLTLSNSTNGATLGSPSTAVLNILVAPGQFQFHQQNFSVGEQPGALGTVTVDRVGGSDGAVTVNYFTTDGTAKDGVNYTGVSGTLTFANGVTSQTFTVPVLNDGTIDGNLSVNLILNRPTGGATLAGRKNAQLVIVDSPGQAQFASANNFVQESAGTALIPISRTIGAGRQVVDPNDDVFVPVTLNYTTSDGSAAAGTDYTSSSGTITFAPGEITHVIAIPIADDGRVGGDKTFTITLSNPAGGLVLGSQTTTTVNILDDRTPTPNSDFNGDGKSELSVFRPTTGQEFVLTVGSNLIGQPGDIPVPGVYDGKSTLDDTGNLVAGVNKTEFAVYRPTSGEWIIQGPNGVRTVQFGAPNLDIPVPADYDGDHQTDLAVYRPTTGQFFIMNSTLGPQMVQVGAPNVDVPVPGDYDGIGRAEPAVYRPSQGVWIINNPVSGQAARQFGAANFDLPVPADYDGDGKTDLALFRPSTAQWIILNSSGGSQVIQFGAPNLDIPVPGDYDGDHKADLAVFRPTTDDWFFRYSSNGAGQKIQFGQQRVDVPADPPVVFRSIGSLAAAIPSSITNNKRPPGSAGSLHTPLLDFEAALASALRGVTNELKLRTQVASTPPAKHATAINDLAQGLASNN